MHDAAEAYVGDQPTPIKWQLRVQLSASGPVRTFEEVEDEVLRCIGRRFQLRGVMCPKVKEADRLALAMEAPQLLGRLEDNWGAGYLPEVHHMERLYCWSPEDAERAFLAAAKQLRIS